LYLARHRVKLDLTTIQTWDAELRDSTNTLTLTIGIGYTSIPEPF
jgi:hypothetical protein